MGQNNHEIFEQHRDISDGEDHQEGVQNPDLRAKADNTRVATPEEKSIASGSKAQKEIAPNNALSFEHHMKQEDSVKSVTRKNATGRGKSIIDRY